MIANRTIVEKVGVYVCNFNIHQLAFSHMPYVVWTELFTSEEQEKTHVHMYAYVCMCDCERVSERERERERQRLA